MIDFLVFGTFLLLILMVIGIFRIGNKGNEIISRLEFQAEQNAEIIKNLTEFRKQQ